MIIQGFFELIFELMEIDLSVPDQNPDQSPLLTSTNPVEFWILAKGDRFEIE